MVGLALSMYCLLNRRLLVGLGASESALLPLGTALILLVALVIFMQSSGASIFLAVRSGAAVFVLAPYFFFSILIYAAGSTQAGASTTYLFGIVEGVILPALLIGLGSWWAWCETRVARVRAPAVILLALSVGHLIWSVLQRLSINWVEQTDIAAQARFSAETIIVGRSTGLFVSANELGFWSVMSFWAIRELTVGRVRWWGMCVSVTTLVLSNSRGSLVAFAAGALFIGIRSALRNPLGQIPKPLEGRLAIPSPRWLVPIIGATATVALLPNSYLVRYSKLVRVVVGGVAKDENLEGRTTAWRGALDYLGQHPYGTLVPPQTIVALPPDNQWVYFLLQGGPLLLGAGLWLVSCTIALARRPFFLGAGIAILINGLTAPVMQMAAMSMFWLGLGAWIGAGIGPVRLARGAQ